MNLDAEKRTRKQINFRLSEREFEKLKQSADTFGMTPSAYAKSLVMKSRLRTPKLDHEAAVALNLDLRRIGTNLNQLAHRANMGELSPLQTEQMNEIRKAVNLIWQQLS